MALASVSVDLDSLPHYCRIHGLDEALLDDRARGLVYGLALERFRELFDAAGLKATLFAIGEDAQAPAAAEALRSAHVAGHEVASHSQSHDYALSRFDPQALKADLRRSVEVLASACGARPVGFRAPGYTLTPALYQAVSDAGFLYGSSTFPAAPYYVAKALVMGALRATGRPSRSVLDTPRVLLAPKDPYFPSPDAPYRRGDGKVLELPMSVSPVLGMPFIGTVVTSLPWPLVRSTYASLRGAPLLNFELHGIDVLDAADGIPPELVARQRDARVPWATKRERLSQLFSWLRRDFDVVLLRDAARHFGAERGPSSAEG